MLILSLKLTKTKIFCMCALLAVVFAGLTLTISSEGTTAVLSKNESKVATNEQRIEYIHTYGHEVVPEPTVIKEIIIPEQFDDVFTKYAQTVGQGGFILENYKGKRVKCYTYTVLNYEDTDPVNINLYCYNNKVAAADISSSKLGGFIKPLQQK